MTKKKKRKELKKEDCPEFEYFNFEPILKWADAKVVYDEYFVDGHGKRHHRPERGYWTLFWQKGFIGFDSIKGKKEGRKKARMAGAMFIYLWCKGIPASIADNLASLYARNVIQYRC